jgi:hypothetical protein
LLDAIVAPLNTPAFDRFVPVPITFNGKMNGEPRGVRGLVARMIYVHFVGMLAQFDKTFPCVVEIVDALWPHGDDRNAIYVARSLDAITHDFATTRSINAADVKPVLLIDEIRLSSAKERPDEIDVVYRAATEHLANRRCILTALDPATVRPSPVQSPKTSPTTTTTTTTATSTTSLITHTPSFVVSGSNKPITWLPLPRLHTDDWETDESDLLLARLTAMAAGHPRTIAIVRLVRATYPTESDATNLLMEVVRLSEVQARLSWQFLVPTFTRLSLEPEHDSTIRVRLHKPSPPARCRTPCCVATSMRCLHKYHDHRCLCSMHTRWC